VPDFEGVGAPTRVALGRDDLAVVQARHQGRCSAPAGALLRASLDTSACDSREVRRSTIARENQASVRAAQERTSSAKNSLARDRRLTSTGPSSSRPGADRKVPADPGP
jgi:hypothetical protein